MNILSVNHEQRFIGELVELLDSSVLTIGDIADQTNNTDLKKAADSIEAALERLVTRELELERVADVLNDFDMDASEKNEALE